MSSQLTVRCLTEEKKDDIVTRYQAKASLIELAFLYSVSPRTIGRVLEERGLARPVPRIKAEAYTVLHLLEEHKVSPEGLKEILEVLRANNISSTATLEKILHTPALTPQNIQTYLNRCTKEELANYFYASGLTKLAEITQQAHERKQQQAALFKPSPQQSSPSLQSAG